MPYRFAIVGCGAIASRHALHIHSLGELVGVCDTDRSRLHRFAGQYRAEPFDSLQKMIAIQQPDIVVICTPNGTHYENALECIGAGADMLCEKPLTNHAEQGRKLVEALRQNGRKMYVVKQNRYNAPVTAVKTLLDENRLGKIHGFQINCFWNRPAAYYENSWRGTLGQDGGTLYTQFSHFIDLLYWFLGDVEQVQGWRANVQHPQIEFEDMGMANLIMQSGAIGSLQYTINAHHSNMEGSFTLFGERGTIKIGGEYLNRLEYFSVENEKVPELAAGNAANNYGTYKGSMSNHRIVYEELIKKLENPAYSFIEAAEALKSVEIIDRIYSASPFVKTNS